MSGQDGPLVERQVAAPLSASRQPLLPAPLCPGPVAVPDLSSGCPAPSCPPACRTEHLPVTVHRQRCSLALYCRDASPPDAGGPRRNLFGAHSAVASDKAPHITPPPRRLVTASPLTLLSGIVEQRMHLWSPQRPAPGPSNEPSDSPPRSHSACAIPLSSDWSPPRLTPFEPRQHRAGATRKLFRSRLGSGEHRTPVPQKSLHSEAALAAAQADAEEMCPGDQDVLAEVTSIPLDDEDEADAAEELGALPDFSAASAAPPPLTRALSAPPVYSTSAPRAIPAFRTAPQPVLEVPEEATQRADGTGVKRPLSLSGASLSLSLRSGPFANFETKHCTKRHRPASSLKRTASTSEAMDIQALTAAMGPLATALPTIETRNELNTISCGTLAEVLAGKFNGEIDRFYVIDCRFPYEYDGGHIVGAYNFYHEEHIESAFFAEEPSLEHTSRTAIIFHCEFSSQRAPRMMRFFRKRDRSMNQWPNLTFPEVYLLEKGYKEFYEDDVRRTQLCDPSAYLPMLADKEQCKKYMTELRPNYKRLASFSDLKNSQAL
eukprot:m.99747 g.99747  ORF g.99747 m.99747 type:complete len:547 (+) comp8907_c0_seq3:177-1817(+)